jgi:2-methylcitrate dehydratase PrpD
MQAGQAASVGVFSAVLAQIGFTGARNIFNGRFHVPPVLRDVVHPR